MSEFGERLMIAFGTDKVAEIAQKLGITYQACKNYLAGRIPDADRLMQISSLTGCDLHWLITGKGEQFVERKRAPEKSLELDVENVDALFSNFKRPTNEAEIERFKLQLEIIILTAQRRMLEAELMKKDYESNPQKSRE